MAGPHGWLGRCIGFDRCILAVLYFAGVFRRDPAKHEFDININMPGVVLQLRQLISRQEPLELGRIETNVD